MKRKQLYLGFEDYESLDEAVSCGGVTMVHNGFGVYLDVVFDGYRVYEYDTEKSYCYENLQALIDNYVFPCGTAMKDIVYGIVPQVFPDD